MTDKPSAVDDYDGLEPLPLASGEHPPMPGAVKVKSVDMADRHQSAQTKARKAALDVLYSAELRNMDVAEALELYSEHEPERTREFTREIVYGVLENRRSIDLRIDQSARSDWRVDRLPPVDRNLARIAVWEMDHTETDTRVIISQAVELADEYSTDKSVGFLNGLLGQAARTRRKVAPDLSESARTNN